MADLIEGHLTNRRFRKLSSGQIYQIGIKCDIRRHQEDLHKWWAFNETTFQRGKIDRRQLSKYFEEVK